MRATRLWFSFAVSGLLIASLGAAHAAPPEKDSGIAVTLTSTPDTVVRGEQVVYGATVKAQGTRLDDVVLTDALPTGMRYVSATPDRGSCAFGDGVLRCSLGQVERKTQAEVRITVVAEVAGSIINTVDVTAAAAGNTRTGSASVTTTVTGPASGDPAMLRVTFTGPPEPALVASPIEYAGQVTNEGPEAEFSLLFHARDNWSLGQPITESFRTSQGTCTNAPAVYNDVFGLPVWTPLRRVPRCDLGLVATGQTIDLSAVVRTNHPTTEQYPLYAYLIGIAPGATYGPVLDAVRTVVTTGTAVGDCALTGSGSYSNIDGYVACVT